MRSNQLPFDINDSPRKKTHARRHGGKTGHLSDCGITQELPCAAQALSQLKDSGRLSRDDRPRLVSTLDVHGVSGTLDQGLGGRD